ncbi:Reduced growth phenotype protein 1 [Quillaja saponaria]|uniref:Reduced growth phenotype protein 1 n=1 Tax=Quillaja saponaria TaxID=32244 RepID=A0AAD7L329_QUISA|nr:Reduced growth phenotype protein 1 [Quillaja saponaria]
MLSGRFSFFGGGGLSFVDNSSKGELLPTLKLHADKDVYRPGDPVVITVDICNPSSGSHVDDMGFSFLVERLSFEIKGMEKVDTQWFATQKPLSGPKQRRGEQVFLDCSTPTIFSNQIVSAGTTKSYVVRTILPSIMPPSYKGMAYSHSESVKDLTELEARIPLQIWVNQKSSGLMKEEEIVPSTTIQMDIFWKEMDGDSDWVRANDMYDGVEEGYDSSRDEISSVSSFNPSKENLYRTFGSSLSLQSSAARSSTKDAINLEGNHTRLSSNSVLPQLAVAEVMYDSGAEILSLQKSSSIVSPSQQGRFRKPFSADDDAGVSSSPRTGSLEPVASEGFTRGRSYNIRLDDQVLLKFSPKNSDSTYYFSDMIGGTLTFFHEEGARRCLEVSITLETSETISRRFVHPSRRNSPTITKVQSDHYEVVADLVQTSFLFSIPMDGPMSFSTPHVSVQWVLRFEFFTTPKNVDWTRYEHPLLIEGRERSEWILPIIVHAPPPGAPTTHTRNEKPFPLENL